MFVTCHALQFSFVFKSIDDAQSSSNINCNAVRECSIDNTHGSFIDGSSDSSIFTWNMELLMIPVWSISIIYIYDSKMLWLDAW